MYGLLLAAALLISTISSSQDTGKIKQDSLNTVINNLSYSDSVQKGEDLKRMTDRSVSYFAQLQKQRNAQKKKQAILYLVLGVVFLIVLIVGFRRRMKK